MCCVALCYGMFVILASCKVSDSPAHVASRLGSTRVVLSSLAGADKIGSVVCGHPVLPCP